MNAVESPLDIVIKTHVCDAVPFGQLRSRLHGRVYVIVPRNERDQFAGLVGEKYILLTAEEVASAAGYIGELPDSWYTQQIIKIIAANIVDHDYYLSVEDEVAERTIIAEPWVGFIHQVPRHDLKWFPDLGRMLKDAYWKASEQNCLGLFVLSTYVKEYLQSAGCEIPIARVLYPAEPTDRPFSLDRFFARSPQRIVSGGEFLRNFPPFFDLKAPPGFAKQLLVHEDFKWQSIVPNDSVELLGRVSDDEYDALLENSIVFLNLRDAPANTTVVECIARNTPILINRLPGVVEYLGEDYPFYYSSLEEADAKLQQPALILETSQYLSASPMKTALTEDSTEGGSIYWDKYTIHALLGEVKKRQIEHQIADRNIFVGECGVSRDAAGGERYLFDVLDVLAEFHWSWAAFAFRDAEWDAMNYELGADLHNMLPGKTSEFFARLKTHFK